ncbi:MAG: hypothetical protein WCO56_23840 [Verrucomicrobiota bacterium]
MKTLSVTEGRRQLGQWCKRAIAGEDIAFTMDGVLVALRPVRVYSEDYALAEYDVSPEQADRAVAFIEADIKKARKAGKLHKFTGKLPRD